MKKLLGFASTTLCVCGVVLLVGTVGNSDLDLISWEQLVKQSAIALGMLFAARLLYNVKENMKGA